MYEFTNNSMKTKYVNNFLFTKIDHAFNGDDPDKFLQPDQQSHEMAIVNRIHDLFYFKTVI